MHTLKIDRKSLKTVANMLLITAAAVFVCSGCSSSSARDKYSAGITDIKDHNYDEAIETLQKAMEEGADEGYCMRGIGIAYMDKGMYPEAASALRQALSSGSGIVGDIDFDTNFYLAESLYMSGDYSGAIDVYNAILNLHSTDANAVYLRGVCNLALGDHDSAMADFTRTIELDKKNYDRIIEIYQHLAYAGYEEEGTSVLQGVWDEVHMTNYELGQISFYLGNNAQAQNYLELARNEKSDKDKTPIILLLGQTGERQGDYNYAISVYRSYLQEDSDHAEVYNRLGLCEMQMAESFGDNSYYAAAVSDFEAGLALNDANENRALLRNEISAYEHTGDFTSAKNLMDTYLTLYPDDAEAQREAQFIATRI